MSARGPEDTASREAGQSAWPVHPIDPFLDAWLEDTPRSYADLLRVYRALSLPGPWDLLRLRRVLQALLARTPEEAARFNRCFDQFFPAGEVPEWLEARLRDREQFSPERALDELARALETLPQRPPVPSLPPRPQTQDRAQGEGSKTEASPDLLTLNVRGSRWRRLVLLGCVLLGLGVQVLCLSGDRPEPAPFSAAPATPPPAPATAAPATVAPAPAAPLPAGAEYTVTLPTAERVTVPMPTIEVERVPFMLTPGLFLQMLGLLLLVLALVVWRLGTRRPDVLQIDPAGTAEWSLPEPADPFPLYESGWLHRLAYQVGVQDEDGPTELDVPTTVRQTLRRGGLLEPHYRPVRMPSTLRLVVPLEWYDEPIAAQALTELKEGIRARGVRLEWTVYRSGRMPKPAVGTVTLIFFRGDRRLPEDLPWGLPSSAFVELREPGLWGRELARLPRRIFSLLPDDLLEALAEASSDLQGMEPRHPLRELGSLERLEGARVLAGMAALASLFGPTSLQALDALRRQLLPESTPFWWQRVLQLRVPVAGGQDEQEGVTTGQLRLESGYIGCDPALASLLIEGLSGSFQLEVLEWQRQRLKQVALPAGTPAWLSHQARLDALETLRLVLQAELREPPRLTARERRQVNQALLRQNRYAQDSFGAEVQEGLRRVKGVAQPLLRWQKTQRADARERSLLVGSGLAELPPSGMSLKLSPWQALGQVGMALAGLTLGGVGSWQDWRGAQSQVEVVQGQVAFALSWWEVEGPFDAEKARLAVIPTQQVGSEGGSRARVYALLVPEGAQQVRVYALAPGGLVHEDVALVGSDLVRLRVDVQEGPRLVREAVETDAEGQVLRDLERASTASKPPSSSADGGMWVSLVSAPRASLYNAAVATYLSVPAVDGVYREDHPVIPFGRQEQDLADGGLSASWAELEAERFVCPGGLSPCVQGLRMREASASSQGGPVPLSVVQASFCPECGKGDAEKRRTPTRVTFSTPLTFVSVPGTGPDGFWMGSKEGEGADAERPRHKVVIQPFQLSMTEVTVAQYKACVDAGKCEKPNTWEYCNWEVVGREQHPINCVDWNQAKAYAAWLTSVVGGQVRLPSEAEWEYAATGGGRTTYSGTSVLTDVCQYGNVADQTAKEKHPDWTIVECRDGYAETSPVGSFKEGAWGLKDMTGNVWEWVEDCWHDSYTNAPADGSAWTTVCSDTAPRVIRGGSWNNDPDWLRGAFRNSYRAGDWFRFGGFRVVLASVPGGEH